MVPSLPRQAANAEDDSSGLQIFAEELPTRDLVVEANVQRMLELAAALRELDDELRDEYNRNRHIPPRLQDDINLLQRCVQQTHLTLDRDLFQQTAVMTHHGRVPYRMLWDALDARLRAEGAVLLVRLELYIPFLQYMINGLLRRPLHPQIIYSLRDRLLRLLNRPDPLAAAPTLLGLRDPWLWDLPPLATPRPRSRLGLPQIQPFPPFAAPGPATLRYEVPPPAPEVDSSPTFTTTSAETWSDELSSSSPKDDGSQVPHWAVRIFDRPIPKTYFPGPGTVTRCFGRADPHAREMLRTDSFLEVMRVPFQDTYHYCRFFWRPQDHRARILISRRDSEGRTIHYCCPITALKLVRRVSRVSLNRYDPNDRRYLIWAVLHFPTYEHQVLFYCAFVALKRQDSEPSPRRLDDHFPDENIKFTGEIEDDAFLHILTMFRDANTHAIRIEASPRRGAMVGTPIWTAFITEHVGARRWIRRLSPNVLELESLRPYVFCHDYTPPRANGHFRLNFTTARDANGFIEQFARL